MRRPLTNSSAELDPIVKTWISSGGRANNQVLRAFDDAIRYARAQGVLYGVDSATSGFARVNAFAGDDLTSVLLPLVKAVGGAVDVATVLTKADHRNHGIGGGFRANGASKSAAGTGYINTQTTPQDLAFEDDQGGFGVWAGFSPDHDTVTQNIIGSWNGTSGWQIRSYAAGTCDGMFGLTANYTAAGAGLVPPYHARHLWTARAGLTDARLFMDQTQTAILAASTNAAASTTPFTVMARNASGTPDSIIGAGFFGGYWMWRGSINFSTDIPIIDTFFRRLQSGLGRGAAGV